MSRSIHTTRSDVQAIQAWNWADEQKQAEQAELLRGDLGHKRDAKKQVGKQRRARSIPLPTVTADSIRIEVRDESGFVHYPASPDDLRAVLRLLPAGILDGIDSIWLCLGAGYQESSYDGSSEAQENDPHTGRLGSELLSGVFIGHTLGVYLPKRRRIDLCAYVYDAALPQREMWEVWLRLMMLKTFVHEVAHHHDFSTRVARGRWRADNSDNLEIYAEKMAHEWMRLIVIPYVERRYPVPLKVLRDWLQQHAGIALPLDLLVGDWRRTAKGGMMTENAFFNMAIAFGNLARSVGAGEDKAKTKLQFARELHYKAFYKEALHIIAGVLNEQVDNTEALTLQADIYIHQKQYDLAFPSLQSVVARQPDDRDAWDCLADVYEAREDWPNLIIATTRLIEQRKGRHCPPGWLSSRARALLETGDYAGLKADLDALSQYGYKWVERVIFQLRAEWSRRLNGKANYRPAN